MPQNPATAYATVILKKDYTVDDIVYDKEKKRYFVSVFEARLDNEESPL